MYARWLIFIGCVACSHLLQASDALSCRQLIDMVDQEQPVDQLKAQSLQSAAGTSPQLKSLAAQSMALLSIRANKYSDAWKHATRDPAALAAASRSAQLTNGKIKLWLLVEARSTKAEDQLKRFVTMTIHADTSEADRQDASYFLGKLLKLLAGCPASCGVSESTIDRARQIMETQSSKTAVSMFQAGWTETEKWHGQLLDLVAKCSNKSQTQATVDDISNELERQQKKTEEARQKQKQEKAIEDKLDRDRNGVIQQIRQVVAESKRETPGRPKQPTTPRSKPSRPGNNADAGDWARYEREMREYDSRMNRYRDDVRDYDARISEWREADRQRRAQLDAKKAELNQLLTLAVSSCKAQELLVRNINIEHSDLSKQLKELQQKLDLSRRLLALSDNGGGSPKLENLQRPSVYPVLDFSRESARLSKMVATP